MTEHHQGSASIEQPEYWWYRARAELLRAALGEHASDAGRVLDVGSADAPSVAWLRGDRHVALDVDPRGLRPDEGVCGSALALPFRDATFDLVGAFDVVEHCEPEETAVAELFRVLVPGGQLLLSVPAYQWAWSEHDVRAGHRRRYTRPRLVAAVDAAGFDVRRATYAFAGVFPMFVAQRLLGRVRHGGRSDVRLPEVSPLMERMLLGLSRAEARVLSRRDLPFGSSIFLVAHKPV